MKKQYFELNEGPDKLVMLIPYDRIEIFQTLIRVMLTGEKRPDREGYYFSINGKFTDKYPNNSEN